MQKFAPTALDDALVPLGRLGTALHARRAMLDASAVGLSRTSDGHFGPDDLIALERGGAMADDERVDELVRLYGLPERPLPMSAAVALVFDRTTGRDVADGAEGLFAAIDIEPSEVDHDAVLLRFLALSVLLCLDVTCGSVGLEALANALGTDLDALSARLATLIDARSDDVVALVQRLAERVVVPSVGILVAQLPAGSLLLARRPQVRVGGPPVPACGRLGDLLDLAR